MTSREKEVNAIVSIIKGILTVNHLSLGYDRSKDCLAIYDTDEDVEYFLTETALQK